MKLLNINKIFLGLLLVSVTTSIFAQDAATPKVLSDVMLDRKNVRTGEVINITGEIALISFLDLKQIECDENCDRSRSQLVMLKSIDKQFSDKGVKVYVVITGNQWSKNQLINFTYNWSLDSIVVIHDADMKLQKHFQVDVLPNILLFDQNQLLVKSWADYAAIADMSFTLAKII